MSTPVRAVLALGSNLGERSSTLTDAVAELVADPAVRLCRVSPLVQTRPVGGPGGQPDFLNLVVEVETTLAPLDLLAWCQSVEQDHHRTREVRWGPRTLDVDVIIYADVVSDDEILTLPHPRAAERAFVLQPWAWMDPEATLGGRPVAELAAEAADLQGLSLYTAGEDG
ncbi:MAG: 2-amino-4-hydroxy-6-hydroxymethyldihydropteridine diphosphokinase [Arthrobacter sp.]|uniref:2-amino-4-hydroxy-6- hydroxymethyldihydropteridine diphosphokinase n=1 Tax=unclassified Arthrobacter TaxID=235627 RepID=UPI0026523D7D|nr:2-amino-4-hydroxy-6-hydroxymethyldihydropteridine diphosphokinase [Micrococcaceae bacterium]MDN5811823.1 2-amino-4-hydroxy-6-hydroxymethyldihydropteridine diphosphokinase [Micrococcaceae bacterium]MDN5823800.1 2-amino-4-hydroxy-6-hydroxymethyldihydropteridine diphosphokinase [Micrococcaceae bacterium]MDN5879802.1 2-amino-4-hydroxy-6-hydroxymethyldihydropteridine diphosphokinase [Micrococcaceae bacterium]MDN5885670.1 2-amino-4-hydroxy-6-hydroxymethyldihydropteridine diphosphokinase [Micrococc